MLVMLLGSFTYAQITDGDFDYFAFHCSIDPVKVSRLAEIQSLTTTNTTIEHIELNHTIDKWSILGGTSVYTYQTNFDHDLASMPQDFFNIVKSTISYYVGEAQAEYDAAAEISATGTLTLASDEDIANATSNDARKHLFSVFSNKTNTNGISITSISFALNEEYGYEVTIAVPNISTGYNAYTYGFFNSFAAMDPGTFAAFYKNVYAQVASYN